MLSPSHYLTLNHFSTNTNYFCLYYPVPVPESEGDTFSQEDLPRKQDTDISEVEVMSSAS